ncbi:MAG: YlxM family DNA-binding protein [Lachnospiraceae bacterium]
MDNVFERTMLYDFYGELLKEHHKNIYEDALLNDLSLSEIAEEQGVSRQAVHEIIKRCNAQLEEYEAKLHLLKKFLKTRETVHQMNHLIKEFKETSNPLLLDQVEHLSEEIVNEL